MDYKDLTKYENDNIWTGGILFRLKTIHNCFVSIKFGNANRGVLKDDCDDYIVIDYLRINKNLDLECFDGAMFYFNEEKSGFKGSILKALPTVLDFIEVDISDLEHIIKH